MKQAIHIFRKDTRLYWPYIAVILAMTIALAWLPLMLEPSDLEDLSPLYWAEQSVPFLLPLAWWLAIERVFHAEPLVSDGPFWETRPYTWQGLLGAKMLFCAVWIALPYVASEWVVLALAGFTPWPMAGDLLWREATFAGSLILPPVLLAAVTRSMPGFFAGILIAFAATVGFGLALWASRPDGAALLRHWFHPQLWPFAVAGIALLGLQFAMRRTTTVRALSLALVACTLTAVVGRIPDGPSTRSDVRIRQDMTGVKKFNIEPDPGQVRFAIPLDFSLVSRDPILWKGSAVLIGKGSIEQLWSGDVPHEYGNWLVFDVEAAAAGHWTAEPAKLSARLQVQTVRTVAELRLPEKAGQWSLAPGVGAVSVSGGIEPKLLWRAPVFYPPPAYDYTVGDRVRYRTAANWSLVETSDSQPFFLQPLRVWTVSLPMSSGPDWADHPNWEGAHLTLERRTEQAAQLFGAADLDMRKYEAKRD